MRAPARPAVALMLAAGLAGCGSSRNRPPSVTGTVTPSGFYAFSDPASGVALLAPRGWHVDRGQAPKVVSMVSGHGTLAVWRYPRTEPLPSTRAELTRASRALVRAVRERDSTFALNARELTRVDGHPVVQLVGQETIAGVRRKVRSLHVYFAEAELVFDAYAPPAAFKEINRATFVPQLRSIRLSRPA
jgi:hypothetical protein